MLELILCSRSFYLCMLCIPIIFLSQTGDSSSDDDDDHYEVLGRSTSAYDASLYRFIIIYVLYTYVMYIRWWADLFPVMARCWLALHASEISASMFYSRWHMVGAPCFWCHRYYGVVQASASASVCVLCRRWYSGRVYCRVYAWGEAANIINKTHFLVMKRIILWLIVTEWLFSSTSCWSCGQDNCQSLIGWNS